MLDVRIDTRRVDRRLSRLESALPRVLAGALRRAAPPLEREVAGSVPVRTGRLRDSVRARRRNTPDGARLQVGFAASPDGPTIGQILGGQYGTRHHPPFARPPLRAIASAEEDAVVDRLSTAVSRTIRSA